MKVTRIAYSRRLNGGKCAVLVKPARRLGRARSQVWQRHGSVAVRADRYRSFTLTPATGALAWRRGDRLYCPGGVVWQAAHAAAINILARVGDPDITLYTPHQRVKQILRERADRHRIRLPIQDSSRETDGGERNIQPRSATSN